MTRDEVIEQIKKLLRRGRVCRREQKLSEWMTETLDKESGE